MTAVPADKLIYSLFQRNAAFLTIVATVTLLNTECSSIFQVISGISDTLISVISPRINIWPGVKTSWDNSGIWIAHIFTVGQWMLNQILILGKFRCKSDAFWLNLFIVYFLVLLPGILKVPSPHQKQRFKKLLTKFETKVSNACTKIFE